MAITLSNITANELYPCRSPLPLAFVSDGIGETLKTISISLKIWNGDKTTSKPATSTYSISLGANTLGSDLNYYELDIAELVRGYLNTDNFNYPSTYSALWAAWVEIDWDATNGGDTLFSGVVTILGTNGYRPYEDSLILPSYYFPASMKVPSNKDYTLTVLDKGVTGATRVIDTIEIDYDVSATSTTAFGTAGTNTSTLFKTATLSWGVEDTYADVNLKLGVTTVFTFRVYKFCYPKYTNLIVGYVNRIGVVDYQFFFGKSEFTQGATRELYKPASDNQYTKATSQYRVLSANGKQGFTTNTNWVVEDTKEKIRDLMLTEYAFQALDVEDSETVRALNPTDSEQTMKQDENELINYTVAFNYAYDFINSVR